MRSKRPNSKLLVNPGASSFFIQSCRVKFRPDSLLDLAMLLVKTVCFSGHSSLAVVLEMTSSLVGVQGVSCLISQPQVVEAAAEELIRQPKL